MKIAPVREGNMKVKSRNQAKRSRPLYRALNGVRRLKQHKRRASSLSVAMAFTAAAFICGAALVSGAVPAPVNTQAAAEPLRTGDRDSGKIAIQCNVAWGEEYLPEMLAVLEEKGVTITFNILGQWAEVRPESLQLIASAGHELGNHGYHHKNYSELSAEEVKEEITTSADLIEELTGVRPAIFAPPSGDYDEECVRAAQELGNTVVLWSVDTIDWRRDGAQAILDRVFRDPQAGDMILMHPVKETAEVLGEIIDGLRERGLEPCRVSDVVNIK